MNLKAQILDANAISRTIKRISHEILEKNDSLENVCLVGIKTRGVPFARRISDFIKSIEGIELPTGVLDITFYRDDLSHTADFPQLNSDEIDFDTTGKNIILVDDVIYTGRTVRAALDAIITHGRPSKIQLAVMCDRGHRELPIRPDYVGKNVPTAKSEIIRVNFAETDGTDSLELYE